MRLIPTQVPVILFPSTPGGVSALTEENTPCVHVRGQAPETTNLPPLPERLHLAGFLRALLADGILRKISTRIRLLDYLQCGGEGTGRLSCPAAWAGPSVAPHPAFSLPPRRDPAGCLLLRCRSSQPREQGGPATSLTDHVVKETRKWHVTPSAVPA